MHFHYQKNHKQNVRAHGGYMLVEILVSLMIFSIVAVSSATAILAIIDANTKAQTTKSVMDNLSVAVENMSRSIRIGNGYECHTIYTSPGTTNAGTCGSGTNGFSFVPQDAVDSTDRVMYYFSTVTANGKTYGAIYRYRASAGVATLLTAPEVDIKSFQFFSYGLNTNDGQPHVLMVINGEAGTVQKSDFSVQTSVTQRQPDCDDSGTNSQTNSPLCAKVQ